MPNAPSRFLCGGHFALPWQSPPDDTMTALALALGLAVASAPPLMLHDPALSKDQVAFSFAEELWLMPRGGGDARLITSGPGSKRKPVFSPDGTLLERRWRNDPG